MGKIFIRKHLNQNVNNRKSYGKYYGRVVYTDVVNTDGLAEHIMQHGSVYTDDVVLGITRKLMHCMAELLAEGKKVRLDGIGTLKLKIETEGVEDPKDFDLSKVLKRVYVTFVPDQSNSSLYSAAGMRKNVRLTSDLGSINLSDGFDPEDSGSNGGSDGGDGQPEGNDQP